MTNNLYFFMKIKYILRYNILIYNVYAKDNFRFTKWKYKYI